MEKKRMRQNDPLQIAAQYKRVWKPKDDVPFQMESILSKMTVVHHMSCSLLALSAVQGEDMRSHKNDFNVH